MIDLRSLSPWDKQAVVDSAEKTGRMIVVHEDNQTCGFGAEVVSTVAESARRTVVCRRVTRPDVWIPCHFPSQLEVLPSFRRVLAAAAELLELELSWHSDPEAETGLVTVDAIGSGPADETVLITEILVKEGAAVSRGDVVALAEAQKSILEISTNVAGVVENVLVAEGDSVTLGTPLVRIRTRRDSRRHKAITHEQHGRPILKRKAASPPTVAPCGNGSSARMPVHAGAGNGHAAVSVSQSGAFRDIPISARQRRLNRQMQRSLQTVPQGSVTYPLSWDEVLDVAQRLRARHAGLVISEFDVLAFCMAKSAAAAPRMRSTLIDEATLREYQRLNLGIAVHLPEDELATAVLRSADRLSFPDFVSEMHARVEQAQSGDDQASCDTQLLLTYLGGLPITEASPVLVAPAVGILFVGAPQAANAGSMINLTLAFDHRVLNGVAAARFLKRIHQRLRQLRKLVMRSNEPTSVATNGHTTDSEAGASMLSTGNGEHAGDGSSAD